MSPKENYEPPLRIQIIVKNIFIIMAYVLILTLFLAIFWYPDRYQAFVEHFSNLGRFVSYGSLSANTVSRYIMTIGFGICSALAFSVAGLYFAYKELRGRIPKAILSIILGIGAVGVAIPSDHSLNVLRILHLTGAACFIGGFTAFNAYLQISSTVRKHVKGWDAGGRGDAILDVTFSVILIIILIGYFAIFALDQLGVGVAWLGPVFQKATVFAMILAFYFIDSIDI